MLRGPLPPVVFLLAAVTAVAAQDRPAADTKRGAYVVKYAAVKDLAPILAKHFKGDAEIQAAPDDTSNILLITAAPAVFDQAMQLTDQLDHQPQSVAVTGYMV